MWFGSDGSQNYGDEDRRSTMTEEKPSLVRCPRLPPSESFFGSCSSHECLMDPERLKAFGVTPPPLLELTYHLTTEERNAVLEEYVAIVLLNDFAFGKIDTVNRAHVLHPKLLEQELKVELFGHKTVALHVCLHQCKTGLPEELMQQRAVLQYILEKAPHTAWMRNDNGETPLHILCNHVDVDEGCLRLLLLVAPGTAGCKTLRGNYPLHVLMQTRRGIDPNPTVVLHVLQCSLIAATTTSTERLLRFVFDGSNVARSQQSMMQWTPISRATDLGYTWFVDVFEKIRGKYGIANCVLRPHIAYRTRFWS